jgi:hypothetical protein
MTKDKAIEKIEQHIMFLAEYDVINIDIAETLVDNITKIVAKIEFTDGKDDYTDLSRYWQIIKKQIEKDSDDD